VRRLGPLLALLLLVVPASALAAPAGGRGVLRVESGLADGGRAYVAPGQRVTVRGRVRPFVPGQRVTVTITRKGRQVGKARALVRRRGGIGQFRVRFTARRPGRYLVHAAHAATDAQAAFRTKPVSATSVAFRVSGAGASGLRVRLLRRGLRALGYLSPPPSRNASFDGGTARAVLAFRKANELGRSSEATRKVFSMLLRGEGAFKLRYPKAGKHVEFDWSRQVLVLASDGKPQYVLHSSSGAPGTPTVFGTFRFYSKTPGTNAKGMVHSSYFIRGYAIHGYASVPNYPASHGCLRIPIPNARFVFDWINLGDRIFVYR
jgi:L,D-transpeptidase-like protein